MALVGDLRAAFQGIECGFLLLSQFVADPRDYSPKRYRMSNVTKGMYSWWLAPVCYE